MDIQIGFFRYFFRLFGLHVRGGLINNTSDSDMFCNTLENQSGYCLNFGPYTDRTFLFGFGSYFGV